MSCLEDGADESDEYMPSEISSGSSTEYYDSDSDEQQSLLPVPQQMVDTNGPWEAVDFEQDAGPPLPPPRFDFISQPGLQFTPPDLDDVLGFCQSFIDEDLIRKIVDETNRYAAQQGNDQFSTNEGEIWTFLGLQILQSLVKKPEVGQYWSRNPLIATPIFGQIMALNRFRKIMKYLHFSDNTTYDSTTHPQPKLNKVWPVYSKLVEKFRTLYAPKRDISIDESLLLFKGHLGWIQYMPQKRARFGMKSYVLCESESGYVWNFIIYTGKGTEMGIEYQSLAMSSQVVLCLLGPLLWKGHCLTIDNFYTSPELGDILVSHNTDFYGTVRPTRKDMPADVKPVKKRGEIASYRRGKLTVIKWMDKRLVTILTSIHNEQMINVEYKRGPNTYSKLKPQAVLDYNETMGGVDLCDQRLSFYPLPRKRGKKYYKKLFFHLLDIAIWNSYVLYQKCGGKKTHLLFRLCLVQQIFEKFAPQASGPSPGRPMTSPSPTRLCGRHFPAILPPTLKKQHPTRVCALCSLKLKKRKETRYYCEECHTSLCVVPCFRIYHTATHL